METVADIFLARGADCRPALHFEDDMVVLLGGRGLVMELAGPLALNRETAGHAEVHDESFAARKLAHEIFRPAAQTLHPGAFDALVKVLRERETQVFPARVNVQDAFTFHRWGKSATNSLDFGQFWHRSAYSPGKVLRLCFEGDGR